VPFLRTRLRVFLKSCVAMLESTSLRKTLTRATCVAQGGIQRHTPEQIIEHKKRFAIAEQERLAAAQKQREEAVVAEVMRKRIQVLLQGDPKAVRELERVQEQLELEESQEDDDGEVLTLEDFRRGVQRYGMNPLEALEEEDETLGTELERQRHAAAQDPFALRKRIYDVEVNRSLEVVGGSFGSSAGSNSHRDMEQRDDKNERVDVNAADLGPFSQAAPSRGDEFDELPSTGSQPESVAGRASDTLSSTAEGSTVSPLEHTRPVDPKTNNPSGNSAPPTL